jgi:plastocyanin
MNKISLAVATAATAVLLAACGGSSSSSSTSTSAASTPAPAASSSSSPSSSSSSTPAASGSSALQLAADPSGALKFTASSLSAKAGKVTIAFTNSASFAHNVTVATAGGAVVGATPTFQGGTKTLSLNLKPGTYTFYCSVPGHRQAGMQGTLVVH